jgi:DNA-binding MarR family transcriptional regulator
VTQDPLSFQLFNEIGIIDQLAGALLDKTLPKGMTRAQFGVLNHFVRLGHETSSPAQLASAFQVTRPTMTSTLARLNRRGLIAIRPDPADGRGKLVSITDEGRAMRDRCIAGIGDATAMLGDLANPAEISALLPVLRRIRIGLDIAR